jgi:protein CpxP
MKKLFVAALLVVGITAFAQEKEVKRAGKERLTSEQKVDFQLKKMSKDLDLNEKQKEQVKALVSKQVEKREQKRKEMQDAKQKDRAAMKSQMQTEEAAVSSEMKKILTPEQFTKWEKIRDERKEKMKEKMAERKEMKELK